MTTTEKTCFKCLETKPLTEFYKHSQMGDGHLNKCKLCTKADAAVHREANLEKIREYDNKRSKLPHRKELCNKTFSRAQKSHPERKKANNLLSNAVRDGRVTKDEFCFSCGSTDKIQGHHYDYSRPLDVTWLCLSCHRKVHAMNHYDVRKKWRVKLHAQRCADGDQSAERYHRDAAVLNRAMRMYGIDGRKATW